MPRSPAAVLARGLLVPGLLLPGLLGLGAGLAATPASAGREPTRAELAGGFLERQLVAGGHTLPYPGTTQADLGLTIDAALGMVAAGVGRDEGDRALRNVEAHLDDYVGPTWGARELYAGPVAKSVLLAATFGADPRSFGGHDLLSDLASLQDRTGRYRDRTAYSDTSNVFTQALAVLALTRTGAAVPAKGVRFLRSQQCADGGFRMFPAGTGCVGDPDATALAVTALLARERDHAAVDAGLDYLEGRMQAGGGVPGGAGAEGANSNTTALAAMAFAVAGRTTSYGLAAGYLGSLQFGCIAPPVLRGAIAYDAESYAAQLAAGLTAEPTDQERRASAQSALGLAGVSLSGLTSAAAAPEHRSQPVPARARRPPRHRASPRRPRPPPRRRAARPAHPRPRRRRRPARALPARRQRPPGPARRRRPPGPARRT